MTSLNDEQRLRILWHDALGRKASLSPYYNPYKSDNDCMHTWDQFLKGWMPKLDPDGIKRIEDIWELILQRGLTGDNRRRALCTCMFMTVTGGE